MNPTDLFELIYQFYPRGMWCTSAGYDETKERARQLEAMERARIAYPEWEALLARLRARYRIRNDSLDRFSGFSSAYSGAVLIPGEGDQERPILFHVSILGPYYVVHRFGWPGEEPYADAIAREIETTYRGYRPIPPAIGDRCVPEVPYDAESLYTIYDCLLAGEWGGRGLHHDVREEKRREDLGLPTPDFVRPSRASEGSQKELGFTFSIVPLPPEDEKETDKDK